MSMFSETKTLIVVSKDEMLINQLKKLVETDKDKYESVKIVAWNEKVWTANKKSGNIDSKVLFIGDVKGVEKLIPVLDVKHDEHGVKYGWAGKQAVIYGDIKDIDNSEEYEEFYKILTEMPIPEIIKKHVGPEMKTDTEIEVSSEEEIVNAEQTGEQTEEQDEKADKKFAVLKKIGGTLKDTADKVGAMAEKTRDDAVVKAQDVFKDRSLMKRQMLFYGVIKMCEGALKDFMEA